MSIARRMLGTLTRRGPDGQALQPLDGGRWVFGHARLAIIDVTPMGAQPMVLSGSDVWIAFNGEIYNYKALRRELESTGHVFRSHSDTEVLLAGYSEWGQSLLDRLDGMFAFALWDGPRSRVWLARDHLGIKPLYYTRDARNFAFASVPKALLEHPSCSAVPDPMAIRDFLSFGYVPGTRSAFRDISKLAGGHALVWENESVVTYRYWNPQVFAGAEIRDEAAAVEETMRLLDLSTESQLESDVPVGVLVSGGIDSSSVASSVARFRTGMEGFVVGFDDPVYDERRYASQLAKVCGIRLNERVVSVDASQALIREMSAAYDEPLADSSTLPSLALFQFVRDHRLKVVQGGDGGDELFVGYRRYDSLAEAEGNSQSVWPLKLAGSRHWRQALRIALRPRRYARPAWRSYYESVRVFSFHEQRRLLEATWRPTEEEALTWPFSSLWTSSFDNVKAAQLFDLETYLPDDILTKVDRASMHYGVEVRVPLLSRRMIEHALRISTTLNYAKGQRKHVLKRGLLGRIPDELLSNRKRGFSLPLELSVGRILRQWLADFKKSGIVRDGLVSQHLAPEIGANLDKAWTLFTLNLWWSSRINRPTAESCE